MGDKRLLQMQICPVFSKTRKAIRGLHTPHIRCSVQGWVRTSPRWRWAGPAFSSDQGAGSIGNCFGFGRLLGVRSELRVRIIPKLGFLMITFKAYSIRYKMILSPYSLNATLASNTRIDSGPRFLHIGGDAVGCRMGWGRTGNQSQHNGSQSIRDKLPVMSKYSSTPR